MKNLKLHSFHILHWFVSTAGDHEVQTKFELFLHGCIFSSCAQSQEVLTHKVYKHV